MTHRIDLSQLTVAQLLVSLASTDVTPGSGAAAGVALALAASCAGKAVAITEKHQPDTHSLGDTGFKLAELSRLSISAANREAARFAEFTKEGGGRAGDLLIAVGEELEDLALALQVLLRELAPKVDGVMLGDVEAAHSLCAAAISIQQANLRENLQTNAPGSVP